MKRILCVAVLMGLTSALHAVVYIWDSGSGSFKSGDNTLGAYKDITSLMVTVVCERSSENYIANYFSLAQKDGTNLLTFGVKGSSSGVAQVTVTNNATLTGGEYWTAERAGNNKAFTVVFDFGERNEQGVFQKLDAAYNFLSDNTARYEYFDINADFNGKSFDVLTAFENTSITTAAIAIEGTPVPEPGVVSLLALGVGALALRRKVAGA